MAKYCCVACGKEIKSKNEIGLNRKLISRNTTVFYCMNCLADELEWSVEYLEDKIKEFKEQGCTLFQ